MPEENQKLAQDRTNWAENRTLMANERTFSSWMGTGLGSIGVAIGLKTVFGDFDPTWAAKLVGALAINNNICAPQLYRICQPDHLNTIYS